MTCRMAPSVVIPTPSVRTHEFVRSAPLLPAGGADVTIL